MSGPSNVMPVRMCVVVPLDNGNWQAYCIACKWEPNDQRSKAAAERQARRHTCRKKGDK